MPTIQFQFKDLCSLLGKKITIEQLDKLGEYGKAELESYDKATDTVTMSCGDTAMPYLWSVEGLARLFKGVLGLEQGIPVLKVDKTKDTIIVDKSVNDVRPHIAMFSAKGQQVTDDLLRQMIQLQEKLDTGFGRKRRKISIGIYRGKDVAFPVTYKAVKSSEIKFIPLGFSKPLNLAQILKEHPTGQKYASTLDGMDKYPVLVDAKDRVLAFIPIINSNDLGKVEIGDSDLQVEVSGTDEEAVDVATNILAYAFADRGFKIGSVTIKSNGAEKVTPFDYKNTIKISPEQVKALIGIDLSRQEINALLETARYSVVKDVIHIPSYRADILHPVDVIEDIAVMYGYDKVPIAPLTSYTAGDVMHIAALSKRTREILVGFGMQEVLSAVLSNKQTLYDKMCCPDTGTVEIKEYMSESYSCVRTWLIPILMDVLSKNKHHVYPQRIFEQGLVTVRKGKETHDYERIASVICGAEIDYTAIRQVADALLNALGVEYAVEETEHPSFIAGRVARITVKGKGVAYLGEIHPKVLGNFDIQLPVAVFELNLTDLMALQKK
ncbi:MAG TPA: phenylalanine--tRNA ligase subunit beta [Candidatus Nanoarchaeia archaeon]|nr:phenylalanine--tRNA ligase subunit beta [Candidatus Nanoarchaeia archaeon]